MTGKKIVVGRPRLSVDFAIVLRMRDVENLAWSRKAEAYREITGQYISRDTIFITADDIVRVFFPERDLRER